MPYTEDFNKYLSSKWRAKSLRYSDFKTRNKNGVAKIIKDSLRLSDKDDQTSSDLGRHGNKHI